MFRIGSRCFTSAVVKNYHIKKNLFYSHHLIINNSCSNNAKKYSSSSSTSEQQEKRRKEFLAVQKLGQLSSKAITNQKLGRFEEAIKVYQEIVEMKPDSIFAMLQIGYILAFELNRKLEAIPHLEHVIELTKIPEVYTTAEEMDDLIINAVEFQPKANYFLAKLYRELAMESSDLNARRESLEKAKNAIEKSLIMLHENRDNMEIQPEAILPFENLLEEIVNLSKPQQ